MSGAVIPAKAGTHDRKRYPSGGAVTGSVRRGLRSWVPAFAGMTMVVAAPLQAATYAITGGTVATIASDAPIEGGTVIVRDGRVVAVGKGIAVPVGRNGHRRHRQMGDAGAGRRI